MGSWTSFVRRKATTRLVGSKTQLATLQGWGNGDLIRGHAHTHSAVKNACFRRGHFSERRVLRVKPPHRGFYYDTNSRVPHNVKKNTC
jgi:hypothetical protein